MSTIAAITTAPGEGGVAMIRISGPQAEKILLQLMRPKRKTFVSHRVYYARAVDAEETPIDEALCFLMRAPKSYTREDVAEIQCHGGTVAARRILERVLELGARPAGPGEFTLRAFENGRMDLTQAEAVMSIVSARSRAASQAAVRQLQGGVSRFIAGVREEIYALLSGVEAADDFPDEVDEEEACQDIRKKALSAAKSLREAADEKRARVLREGFSVALAGRPNVGKSALYNRLSGRERAIVTAQAGTTRDVLTERLSLDGVLLELSDTAGRRQTQDEVEQIGVQLAEKTAREADMVLLVLDGSQPLTDADRLLMAEMDERYFLVRNKCDLGGCFEEGMSVSAATGEGIEKLTAEISRRAGQMDAGERVLTEQRHIDCARKAAEALERAADAMDAGVPLDVCAVDLWESARLLGRITGDDVPDKVIAEIFARFCVGK